MSMSMSICGQCGHGIHAHVDYVSMVVNHYHPTQCAAYVQKAGYSPLRMTPLVQRCTCEAQLCDHVAANNTYRSAEPWNVLDYFLSSNGHFYNADTMNDSMDNPFEPSSTLLSSHDANVIAVATAPIFAPTPHRAFSPSSNAGNVPLTPTSIYSPSASTSASSGIQSDITQTQAYGLNNYFVQYPDHFINPSYACQLGGDATDEGLYYHGDSNVMYGATSGAWPGPYT
ncbi:hypothetical protein EV421DRAFT_1740583 [Armillaria borealis]|uniref:Uncharacterized protein n=1 Tax=Armillaria borealis TaxID=47425 RepID=A0AA39J2J6_9AGAR|nr:hypothetical protein EV421DRAFT_1740583 [Armillaria borealis]